MAIAAAPAAPAGQVGWAHQAAGFQSNGSVTVKSLVGGSYAGTQNPIGATARANQSAVTQAPTVIIKGSNIPCALDTPKPLRASACVVGGPVRATPFDSTGIGLYAGMVPGSGKELIVAEKNEKVGGTELLYWGCYSFSNDNWAGTGYPFDTTPNGTELGYRDNGKLATKRIVSMMTNKDPCNGFEAAYGKAVTQSAAVECDDKSPSGTWFLPAFGQLQLMYDNRTLLGLGSGIGRVLSSNEGGNSAVGAINTLNFNTGIWSRQAKNVTAIARCVREFTVA